MNAPEPTVKTIYQFPSGPRAIEFVAVENVPGFTHRVLADGCPCGWLSSDFRPSKKTAKYFWSLHHGLRKPGGKA